MPLEYLIGSWHPDSQIRIVDLLLSRTKVFIEFLEACCLPTAYVAFFIDQPNTLESPGMNSDPIGVGVMTCTSLNPAH